MKTNALLRALLASSAIAASAIPAAANSASYDFGTLLSGSFAPGGTFAQLSVTQAGFNVFNFTLSSNDLDALFTTGSFIGAIAVNTNPQVTAGNVSISNFSGSGVDGVFAKNGGGPGGGWEFAFDVGNGGGGQQGIHRLEANESASWTATFNSATAVQFGNPGFAMHVQGLTSSQGGSAWYAASPVPEPEIYAMMLSGLLLVGFAARRRRLARFA